ncbi:MAG: putative protein YedJ [Saprospiraceae bacterium]|nr:putative protein YedJ [Saprospiraceae bacterium]
MLNNEQIIERTASFVEQTLKGEGSGHDWWHIYRVWKTSKSIANEEKANNLVVELAALLHDIADWKSYGGDFTIGPKKAKEWLTQFNLPTQVVEDICYIIANISFKGVSSEKPKMTLEGQIVQDADRLDAMGAMGIARTFTYGGSKGRVMYDPEIKPIDHTSTASYVNNNSPSINHFYEKLLLLKNLMNTEYGKKVAEQRHKFMELYLDQFFKEWEGER